MRARALAGPTRRPADPGAMSKHDGNPPAKTGSKRHLRLSRLDRRPGQATTVSRSSPLCNTVRVWTPSHSSVLTCHRHVRAPVGRFLSGTSAKEAATCRTRDPLRSPRGPAALEDYYANRHIAYATEQMPNVIGAEKLRVVAAPGADAPPDYRVSWLAHDSISDLQAGIGSPPGRAVLSDLENLRLVCHSRAAVLS